MLPLSFSGSSSATSASNANAGSRFGSVGAGDFNVNLGGSGVALQSTSSSILVWVALGALAAWMLKGR